MNTLLKCLALSLLLCGALLSAQALQDVSNYTVSWFGNTWGGAPSNNDYGKWVPNFVTDLDVLPDGTCLTAADWDEGGRACTLWSKDGDVNFVTLKPPAEYMDFNSWGVAAHACGLSERYIYFATIYNRLMRFSWTAGDVQSATWDGLLELGDGEPACGMSVRNGKVVFIRPTGEVTIVSDTPTMQVLGTFKIDGACEDIVLDTQNNLWVIVDGAIRKYTLQGQPIAGGVITGVDQPCAINVDHRTGNLMVCESGAARQISVYNIQRAPVLVAKLGTRGGITAGMPGLYAPLKFFSLKGCGTDKDGNLYVAMGNGQVILQKYARSGRLLWDRKGLLFVDAAGFVPGTDGREAYSADGIFLFDYNKPRGQEGQYVANTVDTVRDGTGRFEGTGICRRIGGKRVLFTIGMFGGRFQTFVFDSHKTQIARPTTPIPSGPDGIDDGGWAWSVDTLCNVWHGDAWGTIRRIPFRGFDANGDVIWGEAQSFDPPSEWTEIDRLKYLPETDTMYISGFDREHPSEEWGNTGAVIRRYDNWMAGNRTAAWKTVFVKDDGGLWPNSWDVAGDYLFVCTCKDIDGVYGAISIYRVSDGAFIGHMGAKGDILVGKSGWIDIPYALSAVKRSNGEYCVITEEDWRNKNYLYRWRPARYITPYAGRPEIYPRSGTFVTPVSVSIDCYTPDVTIIYTTDGSTPTSTNGTVYTGPFTVSETGTVKAIATKSGMRPSAVAENTYTILTGVTRAEAENGSFDGGTYGQSTASNGEMVGWLGYYCEVTVNMESAGLYNLNIGYFAWPTANWNVYVNGTLIGAMDFPDGDYGTPRVSPTMQIPLNAGSNTIRLQKDTDISWGDLDLDYFDVTEP